MTEKQGYKTEIKTEKVEVSAGYTVDKEFKISYESFPGTQKKKFADGGSGCATGTKMCCCFHHSKTPMLSETLNSTSFGAMDVHV